MLYFSYLVRVQILKQSTKAVNIVLLSANQIAHFFRVSDKRKYFLAFFRCLTFFFFFSIKCQFPETIVFIQFIFLCV